MNKGFLLLLTKKIIKREQLREHSIIPAQPDAHPSRYVPDPDHSGLWTLQIRIHRPTANAVVAEGIDRYIILLISSLKKPEARSQKPEARSKQRAKNKKRSYLLQSNHDSWRI